MHHPARDPKKSFFSTEHSEWLKNTLPENPEADQVDEIIKELEAQAHLEQAGGPRAGTLEGQRGRGHWRQDGAMEDDQPRGEVRARPSADAGADEPATHYHRVAGLSVSVDHTDGA